MAGKGVNHENKILYKDEVYDIPGAVFEVYREMRQNFRVFCVFRG